MSHNLLHKGGLLALVCVATNDAVLLPCTFQAKYDKSRLHATFSLQHLTCVYGFTTAQSFTFIYNADNLHPTTTTCATANRALTQTELARIARNHTPEVQALSLNLKKPCAILCPNVSGSIAPEASHELVDLAKATEITILFDWKWLNPQQRRSFLDIVYQPETFSGFPIDGRNLRGRRLEDWSVFSPADDHVSNEPPPYTEASGKRALQKSSSPRGSPPPKRVFRTAAGSPTEKATTISTSSFSQLSFTVDKSPHASHSSNAASPHARSVRAPTPRLCSSRAESPHILEDAVKKMMQQMLPEMLDQFIDKPRSISASPPRSDSNPTTNSIVPSLHSIRSLRGLLSARAATYAEQKLATICENTAYDAQYLRSAADEEFLSAVEEQKLDIQCRKDDMLKEFQEDIERIVDENLQELDAMVAQYIEAAEEQVESAINKKLDRFSERKWMTSVARCAAGARGGKTTRAGHTAGHQKRCRFRGICRRGGGAG